VLQYDDVMKLDFGTHVDGILLWCRTLLFFLVVVISYGLLFDMQEI
jgi:methionine aminopeptidase